MERYAECHHRVQDQLLRVRDELLERRVLLCARFLHIVRGRRGKPFGGDVQQEARDQSSGADRCCLSRRLSSSLRALQLRQVQEQQNEIVLDAAIQIKNGYMLHGAESYLGVGKFSSDLEIS